jgi:transposase
MPCPYAPDGLTITSAISLSNLKSFSDGLFAVQDEASQLAAYLLSPEPGDSILDLCAAPGGKATYLAELTGDRCALVACDRNPRKLALIAENESKDDPVDAELLARLGRVEPRLLSPIVHRGARAQADLAVIRARDAMVAARTQLVNHVRGAVKSLGGRMESCSTRRFAKQESQLPEELRPALEPLLELIETMTEQIRGYDRQIEETCREKYPETELLRQVKGVGAVTALAFVLTLEDPHRFACSRSVGSFLGLRPSRDKSGAQDPELHITKAGDHLLRRLLVGSAHYIVGPFGPDSDLRRWGLKLASRGRKNAKKRAVVAVARKLAVLLHRLWVDGEVYQPLYQAERAVAVGAVAGALS